MEASELPADAVATVGRIEAMLAEARRLASTGAADEAAFALRETERRYLPDTLSAYLDMPPSQRDAAATEMVVAQLALLERATAQRLAALSEASRTKLAANGAFLDERFGPIETLPDAPAPSSASQGTPDGVGSARTQGFAAPPHALVARLFSGLESAAAGDPASLVALAAERFSAVLPALTYVQRGVFGGAPRAVQIDVPRGDHVLRYVLGGSRSGIETSCTKVVRGVALRTEPCAVGDWLRALFEDTSAYVEGDRRAREQLASFFAR